MGFRITPAHAGKTSSVPNGLCINGDHPRSRGENMPRSRKEGRGLGSPPLTRGKRCDGLVSLFFAGITPAHAGKTYKWEMGIRRIGDHPRSRGENT